MSPRIDRRTAAVLLVTAALLGACTMSNENKPGGSSGSTTTKTYAFYRCGSPTDCEAGYLCVDSGGQGIAYCKPECKLGDTCNYPPYPPSQCQPVTDIGAIGPGFPRPTLGGACDNGPTKVWTGGISTPTSIATKKGSAAPACLGQGCPDLNGPYGAIPGSCCDGAQCVRASSGCSTEQPDCNNVNKVCVAEPGSPCTQKDQCTSPGRGSTFQLPNRDCRNGRCCETSSDGSCKVASGYSCQSERDCLSNFCYQGTCTTYSECLAKPCSASCCDGSRGFVCVDGACKYQGGGASAGGGSCNAPCPNDCDPSVPHQACLYCQAACVCHYGLTHTAQCCQAGQETACVSQLTQCENDSRNMASALGTTCNY